MSIEIYLGILLIIGFWGYSTLLTKINNPNITARVIVYLQSEELDEFGSPTKLHQLKKAVSLSIPPSRGMLIEHSDFGINLKVTRIIAFDGGIACECESLVLPSDSLNDEIEYLKNKGWNYVPAFS